MKKLLQLKFLALAFVAACLLTSFMPSTPAHAWTGGQQIAIKTKARSVLIKGYNQNNQYVQNCFELTFWYPPASDGYSYLTGWWWKGSASISYDMTDGNCWVPTAADLVTALTYGYDWLWHTGPV